MNQPSRIAILLTYVGPWPPWTPILMRTIRANPDIDWLLIGAPPPQADSGRLPDNVRLLPCGLPEIRERAEQALGCEVALSWYYKLCDLRPMLGVIYEDELRGYDFWGHCDPDVAFGRLRGFLTEEVLAAYDKVLIRGHLSLYRNREDMNLLYQRGEGTLDYRGILADPNYLRLDEWGGVYKILQRLGIDIYREEVMADISPQRYRLTFSNRSNYPAQSLVYHDDRLYHMHADAAGDVRSEEIAYAHFMKRPMRAPEFDPDESSTWAIGPRGFQPLTGRPTTPAELAELNPDNLLFNLSVYPRRVLAKYRRLRGDRLRTKQHGKRPGSSG